MTWRIEVADTNDDMPLVTVIKAQAIWKRLSKAAQEAVADAYPNMPVDAHSNTMGALRGHGFVEDRDGWYLTEAGKAVAKWCVPHA